METANVGRYVALFAAVLVATASVALLVVYLTGWEPNGSVGFVEMLFASSLTGAVFVQRKKRIPTHEERRRLIWLSLAASFAMALTPIAGFLVYCAIRFGIDDLMQGISETLPLLPLFVWAIIVAVTVALTYASLYLGYVTITSRLGKQMSKSSAA